jgi:hypothetical protein
MSIKDKLVSAKNNIVKDITENKQAYINAVLFGALGGIIFVGRAVIKSHNELYDLALDTKDTVNHNARASNYNKSHPLYIEKHDDGSFTAQQTYFPEYDQTVKSEE